MKLSCHYTMRAQKRLPIHVPFDLCVEGISAVGTNIEQVVDRYALKLEGPVDHREIEYVEEPVELLGGGTICNKGLRTDATKRFSGIANFVCRYLSFACQIPVSLSGSLGRNGLTPETDDDQEFLSQFPTDRLYEGIKMTGGDVWSVPMLISAEQNIEYFRQREVGLAIYADSLRVSEPVAMFRELWRVLESAFGQKDDDLVRSLKRFEPLAGIGSVDGEFNALCIIRGRASHAQSRGGLSEYLRVTALASEFVCRMRSIVECVILTKKNWGSRDCESLELGIQRGFVNSEGNMTIVLTEDTKSEAAPPDAGER